MYVLSNTVTTFFYECFLYFTFGMYVWTLHPIDSHYPHLLKRLHLPLHQLG